MSPSAKAWLTDVLLIDTEKESTFKDCIIARGKLKDILQVWCTISTISMHHADSKKIKNVTRPFHYYLCIDVTVMAAGCVSTQATHLYQCYAEFTTGSVATNH